MKLIETLKVENELGEGVIWDNKAGLVWWTDIQGCQLFQYNLSSQDLKRWQTPERLCCFTTIENGSGLAVAFESGFAFYDPEMGNVEWIKKLEGDNPGTRFNDGRTDRQGRLWSGTMIEDADRAQYKGSLYCLDSDLKVHKTIGDLSIPNSLCWSPDGSVMYHTDTPTREIKRYKFEPVAGTFGEPEVLVKTDRGCYPDGSTIDSHGYLWNAQWGGSKVVRYTPDGEEDLVVEIPTKQPSCVAFGGEDLNLLIVTSAYQDMDTVTRANDSLAGSLFIFETEFRGLKERGFVKN